MHASRWTRPLLAAAALLSPLHAQTNTTSYGCDPALAGSLELLSGSASPGQTFTLGVDDPLGVLPPGQLALLAVATAPAPGFPCGPVLPGLGIAGPYGPGELLISLVPPDPFLLLGPELWLGTGQPAPISLGLPANPALADVSLFFQGVLVDPAGAAALTAAQQIVVNRCAGFSGVDELIDVGPFPRGIATGDFDEDGFPDLAVVNESGDDFEILLGGGDGTFSPQPAVPTNALPFAVEVLDFQLDGHLDLAILDQNFFQLQIFLGNGMGDFSLAHSVSLVDDPYDVEVADLDQDGFTDFAVVHELDDLVSVVFNLGGSSLGAPQVLPLGGEEPHAIEAGDLNADGLLDLVTANNDTDDLSVFLGLGGGTFAAPFTLGMGNAPFTVTIADLNGDGVVDLLSGNRLSDDVSIRLGLGAGAFTAPATHETPSNPNRILVVDVDGGGELDLVIAHDTNLDLCSVSFGRGDGTFSDAQTLGLPGVGLDGVIADFDADGDPDLALSLLGVDQVAVLLNGCAP